jgi:hypothetical protein
MPRPLKSILVPVLCAGTFLGLSGGFARHIGSPLDAIARDAAVTVSIALQFGADLETISAALTRDHDGGPATLLGAALDALLPRPEACGAA